MPFIVDRKMRISCVEELKKFDSRIYFSQVCDWIYEPINSHPDLQIHFVSEKKAFVPPELFSYYKNILPEYLDLTVGNKRLGSTYPDDAAYNITRIGLNVILNTKIADEKIMNYYQDNGFNIIDVRQGYTKCNICTDGEAAVTEDEGIYQKLSENGIKTLKIPVGEVLLNNFPYGFIGGASGHFKNTVFFTGTIKNNEIFSKIKEFFAENGTDISVLDNKPVTDYGSILYFE